MESFVMLSDTLPSASPARASLLNEQRRDRRSRSAVPRESLYGERSITKAKESIS